MNTTDEQFRQDLAHALDATAHEAGPVDVAGLIDAGRTRLRRQRLGASAGALALVVALGLGTWAALPRSHEAVPASPTAPAISTVRLEVAQGPAGGGGPETLFDLALEPDGRLAVTAIGTGGAQRHVAALGVPTDPGRSSLQWDGTDLVVGVVPVEAVAVDLLDDGGAGGHATAGPKALPGTGFSAVAFRLDQVPTGRPGFEAVWWRADGVPVTDTEVGSVLRLEGLRGGDAFVWVLPSHDRLGLRLPGDSEATTALRSEDRVRQVGVTAIVEDAPRGLVSGDVARAYLLAGRTSGPVTTSLASNVAEARQQLEYWPGPDVTVVLVQTHIASHVGTAKEFDDRLVTRLEWIDAQGQQQVWGVPKP